MTSLDEFAVHAEADIDGDKAKLSLDLIDEEPSRYIQDPGLLLRAWDLDPTEWLVDKVQVKSSGTPRLTIELHRIWLKRANPPPHMSWFLRTSPPVTGHVAVLSDHQAPMHDAKLHDLACDYLRSLRPSIIVVNGDLIDLPTVSKYRVDPFKTPSVQECVDAGYAILRDYRMACPGAVMYMLPGNHEQRLQNILLDKIPALHMVRPGQTYDIPPPLSVPNLLRLDELKIEWATSTFGPEWPHAELVLSKHLSVMHGWIARKGSGASALGTLEALQRSIIVGHTHRSAIVLKRLNGSGPDDYKVLCAVEAGTMCYIPGGLGHTVAPNWQNSFAQIKLYDDGTFHAGLVPYVDGRLYTP